MPKRKNYRELALLEGNKDFPVQGIIGWRWDAAERRQFRAVFPNKTYGNTLWQHIQRVLGWASQSERNLYPPTRSDDGTIKYPHMVEITWPRLWIDEEQFSAEARELIEGFLAQHPEPVDDVQEEQNVLDQVDQNVQEEANAVAEQMYFDRIVHDVEPNNMAPLVELDNVQVAGYAMPQVPEPVEADMDMEIQGDMEAIPEPVPTAKDMMGALALLELAGQ